MRIINSYKGAPNKSFILFRKCNRFTYGYYVTLTTITIAFVLIYKWHEDEDEIYDDPGQPEHVSIE